MNRHQIGNQIAQRYQLRSLIGRGGMGAVYQSLDTKTQRLVALKLIRPEFSSDLKTRRRFNKEARAFAYLKHPNIVEVYDFGQDDDGTLFLAIELVDGHSLRAWRRLALPLSSILSITDQLLAALAHAHARGVIHRDLKPENVLLYLPAEATVPTVKLVDFGLASLPSVARGASQQTGTIIGTPSYMAPEQARPSKGVVGPGTDIYAVGVILYELLCDRLPYEGDGGIDLILKHLQQPVPPLVPRPGLEIPELLSQVVQRALAKKPWDRFVNAADFRRALQAVDVVPEPMPRLELPALDTADGGTQHPTPERLQTPTQSTPTSQRSERSLNERVRSSTRWSVLPRDGGPAASVQIPTPPVGTPSINSDAFATGSGPMLGREVELHRVQEICERALNGQGQIVIIEGESGIGKSRFVRSLVHRYTETGLMRAASGLYAATDGNGPNIGIRGALEVAFATSDMDRSAMRIQVRGVLERLGILDEHDKNELIEYLRPSRNLQTKAVAEVSDASAQRQRSMHALLQRVFRLLAQEIPFLVIFEDVHWATDGIELFLESTASSFRVHSTPCLFVCTATPEELASNPGINEGLTHLGRFEGSCVHRLSLSRLSRQDSLALIRSILPLDPKVADGIATKSGGNPFYAVHFLNSLRQDNRLVKAQGSSLWKLREEYQLETALPPSVADILRRRLQRTRAKLGEKAPLFEELLVRVAILGMSISEPLIEAFLRQEGDAQLIAALDEALDAWINAGLLRENNDRQSDLLAFDHVLIRQVILEDVPSRKLRRLHKIAAITKREHFYPYLQAVASDIADHYLAAGEVEASCEYTLLAARSSESLGNFQEAQRHFTQLLKHLDPPQENELGSGEVLSQSGARRVPIDWSEVYLGLGRIAIAQGKYDEALQQGQLLMARAERNAELLGQGKGHWLLGRIATRRGQLVEAWDRFNTARDFFEASEDMLGVAQCLWGLGQVAQQSGWLVEARSWLDEAKSIYDTAQRPLDVAACLQAMGATALAGGLLDEARTHYEQAQATFEGARDRYNVHHCLLGLARIYAEQGKLQQSLEFFDIAQTAFIEFGDRHAQIDCILGMAISEVQLGHAESAAKRLSEATQGYRQLNDMQGLGASLRAQAMALRLRGASTEAIQFLSQALEKLSGAGDRQGQADCYLQLARIAIDMDDAKRAENYFNQAHELYSIASAAIGIASCAEIWSIICAQRGALDEALAAARDGLDVAAQSSAMPLMARLYACAMRASSALAQFTELRQFASLLDELPAETRRSGEPSFEHCLQVCAQELSKPGVDPDLRGLRTHLLSEIEQIRKLFRT